MIAWVRAEHLVNPKGSAVRFAIIGGGIVGLATGLELLRAAASGGLEVQDPREGGAGRGAAPGTHNSGVLHAGLYYRPGSLKAKLAVGGIRRMVEFCRENGVAHEICGKVVVATDEAEVSRLRNLFERGGQNGLKGLRWLSADALREIEPNAAGLAAVQVPEEGIVNFEQVCAALRRRFEEAGGTVRTSARLIQAHADGGDWRLETTAGEFPTDFLVNCGGLHCDRIAQACGEKRATRILPFRGEYYELRPSARYLVRNLIYLWPPDPALHARTRGPLHPIQFGGGIEAGPNAVTGPRPRGAAPNWKVNPPATSAVGDAVAFRGFWNCLRRHPRRHLGEIQRSWSRRILPPRLAATALVPARAEIRPRPRRRRRARAGHPSRRHPGPGLPIPRAAERPARLLNAPSPAATAVHSRSETLRGRPQRSRQQVYPRSMRKAC